MRGSGRSLRGCVSNAKGSCVYDYGAVFQGYKFVSFGVFVSGERDFTSELGNYFPKCYKWFPNPARTEKSENSEQSALERGKGANVARPYTELDPLKPVPVNNYM